MLDAGVAYTVAGHRRTLLLRAGANGTLASNNDGTFLASAGPYVGIGALVHLTQRIALRADVTAREFVGDLPAAVSVGVGLALLPRAPTSGGS